MLRVSYDAVLSAWQKKKKRERQRERERERKKRTENFVESEHLSSKDLIHFRSFIFEERVVYSQHGLWGKDSWFTQ
jgi:hypothetical protein